MGSLWSRSGTVERYADDLRASGAKAYFFQGGTISPLSVFQNSGESAAYPHPVVADANGRWPDVFVPYITSYDVRVTTADDVQLTYTLQIPNPDPIEQTVIIPPENQVQTGMVHAELVNTTKIGYVRLNGRTIGNAASTATERANPDTSALFTYLWNNLTDAIAPVSGGRGGSAAADYGANKAIGLPDMRGNLFAGLDDMGSTAANAFAGLAFNVGSATMAGGQTGINLMTLGIANMPAHTHTGSTSSDGQHTHTGGGTTATENQSFNFNWGGTFTTGGLNNSIDHTHNVPSLQTTGAAPGGVSVVNAYGGIGGNASGGANSGLDHTHQVTVGGTTGTQNQAHNHNFSFTTSGVSTLHSHTFTTSSVGSSTPFNNMPLTRLVTWYIKL